VVRIFYALSFGLVFGIDRMPHNLTFLGIEIEIEIFFVFSTIAITSTAIRLALFFQVRLELFLALLIVLTFWIYHSFLLVVFNAGRLFLFSNVIRI
jgi:hypothetical protein